MIDVIPGILEKDWPAVEAKLNLVVGVVPTVQIDIADNTLVPNETLLDFTNFMPYADKVALEAHLMVANPAKYIRPLADAGFRRLIAHVESQDPRDFLKQAVYENVEVGLALDGASEIDQVEPFLEEIDTLLSMTIEAGFSGQPFIVESVEKIKTIHQSFPDLPIEVDGGINADTAKVVTDAAAT